MKSDHNDTTMPGATADSKLNRERDSAPDLVTLATTDYDRADQTLDKLEFVMCALTAMETSYSDQTVNGLVQIIDDIHHALREYVDATRAVLISVADGGASDGGRLPNSDLEDAVDALADAARAAAEQMRIMAPSAEECGEATMTLADKLERAVADVDGALDRAYFGEE